MNFKLNVKELEEQINIFKTNHEKLNDDLLAFYRTIISLSDHWNDNNSFKYIDHSTEQQKNAMRVNDAVNNYMDELKIMIGNIENTLKLNGCKDNIISIQYNSDNLLQAINYLNQASYNAQTIANKASCIGQSCDQDIINKIRNISSSASSIGISIRMLVNYLTNIRNEFNNNIIMSKKKINALEYPVIEENTMKYQWDVLSYVKDDSEVLSNRLDNKLNTNVVTLNSKEEKINVNEVSETYNDNQKNIEFINSDIFREEVVDYEKNETEVLNDNIDTIEKEVDTKNYETDKNNSIGFNSVNMDDNRTSRYEANNSNISI